MKRTCPICGVPTESGTHADFPFCGERCRLRDLGNWASEKYVVPDTALDEDALNVLEKHDEEKRENDRERKN